ILGAADPELGEIEPTSRWHGLSGHAWEQLTLPRIVRKTGGAVLWSPCNWGPIASRRQVVVIHDIAPLTQPEYFTFAYRGLARLLTGPVVRRAAKVTTPSSRVRGELIERFSPADDVLVVPPGVGTPFTSVQLDDLERRPGSYCLHVGAHDPRKNAEFLLELGPEVHRRTGLELHVTHRPHATAVRKQALEDRSAGVTVHVDPTDDELARLYADALCLLWPSH